jgi:hypothetical protein
LSLPVNEVLPPSTRESDPYTTVDFDTVKPINIVYTEAVFLAKLGRNLGIKRLYVGERDSEEPEVAFEDHSLHRRSNPE